MNSLQNIKSMINLGNCINTFDTIEGVPLTGLMPQTRPVYFSNEKQINRYEINH